MRPRPYSRAIERSVSARCPLPLGARALAQCERPDKIRATEALARLAVVISKSLHHRIDPRKRGQVGTGLERLLVVEARSIDNSAA